MILSANFIDNDTANGRFTGTVSVYEANPWLKVVDGAAMISHDDGFYTYDFVGHDYEKDYVYICKGVDSLGGPDRYVRREIDANPMYQSNVEGAITVQEALAVILAFVAGKAAGGGTASVTYRNQADSVNRLTQSVDASGNRSATALDTSDL